MAPTFETVTWKDGKVVLLDQLRLPAEEVYRTYETPEAVAEAAYRRAGIDDGRGGRHGRDRL